MKLETDQNISLSKELFYLLLLNFVPSASFLVS